MSLHWRQKCTTRNTRLFSLYSLNVIHSKAIQYMSNNHQPAHAPKKGMHIFSVCDNMNQCVDAILSSASACSICSSSSQQRYKLLCKTHRAGVTAHAESVPPLGMHGVLLQTLVVGVGKAPHIAGGAGEATEIWSCALFRSQWEWSCRVILHQCTREVGDANREQILHHTTGLLLLVYFIYNLHITSLNVTVFVTNLFHLALSIFTVYVMC